MFMSIYGSSSVSLELHSMCETGVVLVICVDLRRRPFFENFRRKEMLEFVYDILVEILKYACSSFDALV